MVQMGSKCFPKSVLSCFHLHWTQKTRCSAAFGSSCILLSLRNHWNRKFTCLDEKKTKNCKKATLNRCSAAL
jgi:hypothetical protein